VPHPTRRLQLLRRLELIDRVRFAFGPRKACEEATTDLGGQAKRKVTLETDYVVIGTFGSRDWVQSSFGRKIEKAVEYRENYGSPAIISEDHWAGALT
jgi:hypothetical protein